MIKRTIKYTDYFGEEREEDFYFNLTKPEVIELQLNVDGGLRNYLDTIIRSKDSKKILEMFKKLIAISYGEKSPDGKRFVKSEEISKSFFECPAYEVLYMQMVEDADFAATFVKGILPADLAINFDKTDNE